MNRTNRVSWKRNEMSVGDRSSSALFYVRPQTRDSQHLDGGRAAILSEQEYHQITKHRKLTSTTARLCIMTDNGRACRFPRRALHGVFSSVSRAGVTCHSVPPPNWRNADIIPVPPRAIAIRTREHRLRRFAFSSLSLLVCEFRCLTHLRA